MKAAAERQQEVFAFLADPAAFGNQAETVKRVDTHSASVFLAGERVVKVKRAVKFPFLDYSTLAKRKQACEAELAVNAPYAPDIYRAVIPITRKDGGKLAIGGDGEPVEWAVEMRRFDEKRTLDRITNEIDDGLADRLGRTVAAAHARAKPAQVEPWIEAIGGYIGEHADTFAKHPDIFSSAENDAFAKDSRAAWDGIVPLLRERARLGLIRRIHGDLHLGNIVMIASQPVLFDAIEFSDIIASGDVFYDLAFLLMDLLERGLSRPANIVLNRYLAESHRLEDLDALATLPFFLALRAAIRARVTVARMERTDQAERERIKKSARAYFAFARRALAPAPSQFIALGGLSGTGKSRLARDLAPSIEPMPGAVIIRSDVERKALFGIGETDKLAPDAYTPTVTKRVYSVVVDKAKRILAAGHSVIVDAVFARSHERDAMMAAAKASGRALHGLFLTAALSARVARIGDRAGDASDADKSVAEAQEKYDLGPLDWTEINASGTPAGTLERANKVLSS